MMVVLPDALHARPANLIVRLAAQHHTASVRIRKGTCSIDARKILDVLSLGAAKGDEIEVLAEGEGAELAIAAVAELVLRNFDSDLVPETGSGAVPGIAIGRALVVNVVERVARSRGTTDEELARLDAAAMRALSELESLMAALAPDERALFEPEVIIVREITGGARERIEGGETAEEAVAALTNAMTTDLLLDARSRLADALSDDDGAQSAFARAESLGDDVVLVAELLTPSLVAALPHRVRGLVAIDDGDATASEEGTTTVRTSHAAILARGRELPLAFVPSHVALGIVEGDRVVIDTLSSPARVWIAPSEALLVDARTRRDHHLETTRGDVARGIDRVTRALGVSLLVNVGSLHDRVPDGVAGVGLLRTELLFADRKTPPSERDQVAALLTIARNAKSNMVTVRLWDAGGDKPLAWLSARTDGARGAALLFENGAILDAQVAAIARAAERARFRILIPMTRSAEDVHAVRARAKTPNLDVGAMIETPEAALDADAIAGASDFICIGTNDLAALVLGTERSDARQALHPDVLAIVAGVVAKAHARGKPVTVCGEVAADDQGARILVGLGVDGLSVASPRLGAAVSVLDGATKDECRAAALAALAS